MNQFKYYIVLGAAKDPYPILTNVIDLLEKTFNVIASSKFYYGPAEGANSSYSHFMNVALLIEDSTPLDLIRKRIQSFERYNLNSEKIVDIDLLIQTLDNKLLFLSNKIKFCHTLITLNELCPDLKISNTSLQDELNKQIHRFKFKVVNLKSGV